MKKGWLLLLMLLSMRQIDAQSLTIGERKVIRSSFLNENRTLNVYLPEGYKKDSAYPVLYLLDGSMNEDFLHIAGLVQFFHMTFQMPEMIVVGIENIDRKRDFTFRPSDTLFTQAYPNTGHSDIFIRFLEEEMIPFIEGEYRTTKTRMIIGQSLGGLLVTELMLKKPDMFSFYGVVSPSLWWDNESLLLVSDALMDLNPFSFDQKVYIAFGADEDRIMRKDARSLVQKIKAHGHDVVMNEMKGEDHATILHHAVYDAFLHWFVETKGEECQSQ